MAITARFGADFSSFYDAVQKADTQLKGFEGNASKVGGTLNKIADSFSGSKIIQQATLSAKAIGDFGGVSNLTQKELQKVGATATEAAEKFRVLGQTVPREIQAIADAAKSASRATEGWGSQLNGLLGTLGVGLSAGALVGFAKSLLDMGDQLVRVADRTGLTTTEVQKLQFIAGQSGNTIDELTGAIGKLQKNLLTGDSGAVTAVKALGLNLEALKSATPFEQMEQIATAIEKIPDPASRATIAMELFGKGGAAILPTLVSNFKALGNEAPVMSDKTVRALDAAGDSLAKFGLQIKVLAAESYNFAGQIFDRLTAAAYDTAASILKFVAGFLEIEKHIPGVTTAFNALGISTEGIRQQAQQFNDTAALQISNLSRQEVAVRNTAKAVTDFEPAAKKAGAATKAFKYEVVGLGDAGEKFIAEFEGRTQKALAAYYERLEQIIPAQKEWWNLLANPPQFALPGIQTTDNTGAFQAQNKSSADALQRQMNSVIGLMPDLGKKAAEQFDSGFAIGLEKIAGVFSRAFEGGGGLVGAFKSLGVMLAKEIVEPLLNKLSVFQQRAVSVGTTAAAALGGAFGGATGATIGSIASSVAGVALAHTALASSTIALGAATAGIGAAAVGVYLLARHWLSVSQAEKDARKSFDDFNKALGGSNVNDFIARASAAGAALGKNGEEVRQLIQRVLDATHKSPQALAEALKPLADMIDAADKKVAEFNAGMETMKQSGASSFNAIAAAVEGDRDSLAALGAQAVMTFATLVASGMSQAEALKQLKPGLDSIKKSYEALGISIQDAGLSALLMQETIADGNPALIAGLDGLNSNMQALQQLGLLNADTFGKMETTGAAMYRRLQDEANKAGGSTADALLPMQTYLHQAEKAAKDLGIPLDDNTQLLIDQSKELGIWKDAGKSSSEKVTDAMAKLVEEVQKLVDTLNSIPHNINTTVTTSYATDGTPPAYGSTGGLMNHGTIYAAQGTVVPFSPRGSDVWPAMLSSGEAVLNRAATARLGAQTINKLNRGDHGAAGGTVLDFDALKQEFAKMRLDQQRAAAEFPKAIARAVRDEMQRVVKR